MITATTPPVVLDPVVHKQIIADMDRVCEVANVPASFIRHSMKSFCHDGEIEWVRKFPIERHAGLGGLALVGAKQSETRCMAIAGTLVRNFIDARVMTLNSIIDHPEAAREPTVLVIPNLFFASFGKQLTAWQVQVVYDVLLNRMTANKPTVVCVESLQAMGAAYGPVFEEHIKQYFRVVQ